jgi:hypothetical protein
MSSLREISLIGKVLLGMMLLYVLGVVGEGVYLILREDRSGRLVFVLAAVLVPGVAWAVHLIRRRRERILLERRRAAPPAQWPCPRCAYDMKGAALAAVDAGGLHLDRYVCPECGHASLFPDPDPHAASPVPVRSQRKPDGSVPPGSGSDDRSAHS